MSEERACARTLMVTAHRDIELQASKVDCIVTRRCCAIVPCDRSFAFFKVSNIVLRARFIKQVGRVMSRYAARPSKHKRPGCLYASTKHLADTG